MSDNNENWEERLRDSIGEAFKDITELIATGGVSLGMAELAKSLSDPEQKQQRGKGSGHKETIAEVWITAAEAKVGRVVRFIFGRHEEIINIPPETHHGMTMHLKQRGLPFRKDEETRTQTWGVFHARRVPSRVAIYRSCQRRR